MPYLTNENAFELRERPKHLIVLGAGPVGLELAQAFRRLGSEVTVLDTAQPLGREDPECSAVVLDAFAREGITVRGGVKIDRVRRAGQRVEIVLAGEEIIQGTDLLVAAGRRPNIDALDLGAGRIRHEPNGIVVNRRFGTSNRRVYAIGDVTGLPAFTHSANHQAGLLIRHLLFRLPVQAEHRRDPPRDLHRSGAGPCRPDRQPGARAPRRHPGAALALFRERPGPDRTAKPAAISRW